MHYANGRSAKAGDLVRGKGYNIKHEIVGLLIRANPSASSCNCNVATVTAGSTVLGYLAPSPEPGADGSVCYRGFGPPSLFGVMATIEYGQLDAFLAIDPETGEVLPPEPETIKAAPAQ